MVKYTHPLVAPHCDTPPTQNQILPQPPPARADDNPWPQWPRIFRVDYGHAEVQAKWARDPRHYNIMTKNFISDGEGRVKGVRTVSVQWTQDDNGYVRVCVSLCVYVCVCVCERERRLSRRAREVFLG